MAIDRRQFLERVSSAAAGMAISRADAVMAAFRQSPARRRDVHVRGRRVKTIDVHAHCVVPEAMALVPGAVANPSTLVMGPERLPLMDAHGIDVQVLSINQFWYGVERDLARRVVDLQNHRLAEFVAANPDRFAALATVALQYPDDAAEQLNVAVKSLGLQGVAIAAHVNGDELSATKFRPFWAAAERLGVVVFIHPQAIPELQPRLRGNGALVNVIGNPLDTTIALSHLIFEGTLDDFPGLRICAAHGGGYLGSYSARSDHGCAAAPGAGCTKQLEKHPSEYLKQIYADSIVFTSESLRHLVAEFGADRIVLGTDYPYPWNPEGVDHVLSTPSLSDDDRVAILSGNAARLLRIPV